MKNYVRDEYNRQVRALMEMGCAICVDRNLVGGSFSSEDVRIVLEGTDGSYYGVIVTREHIWHDQHEELGVHTLVDEMTCVMVVRWTDVHSYSTLWLKDAEELECIEFFAGNSNEEPVPKAEANARAEKQYERWEARVEWRLEDKTDDQAVREVVLRHARKQRGTKRANDSDIVRITKDNERTPASGFRYTYIINKRNGEEERRYI